MRVAVVKLGVGNTASVMFALGRLGADAFLTSTPAEIAEAERVILPGVGAASHAVRCIAELGLAESLRNFSRPLLGICLGQQILYERSAEGQARGLGVFSGEVTRLPASIDAPIPHMGWERISALCADPLLEGIAPNAYFYFVHSYVCPLGPETLASAEYGKHFSAVSGVGRTYGCQFHPERSGAPGRRLLENFLHLSC